MYESVKVFSCSLVSDSCDSIVCSLPGSSVHEILQARILEWVAISFPYTTLFRSVVSDSLRPHGPQHTRPPYPSPTPGVYSDLCPSSQ